MPVSVTQTGDRDEPLEWWLSATGVPQGKIPKKDNLVVFPEARASQLIPTLASRYRDSTGGEADGSSSRRQEAIIPDNVYLSVVRNVLNEVHANPLQFHRTRGLRSNCRPKCKGPMEFYDWWGDGSHCAVDGRGYTPQNGKKG